MTVSCETFGRLADGTAVEAFEVRSAAGIVIKAITYGGIIVSLETPDRDGNLNDIVLGFDEIEPYLGNNPYFGAIVGRYANRIAGGRFELDGTTHALSRNLGPNHLHGGFRGFDKVVWDAEPFEASDSAGVVFGYTSRDGEEGYPGNLDVSVRYTLRGDTLTIDYSATTDAATPINLTQHTYFNLAGAGDVLGHELLIQAERFTAVDEMLLPDGDSRSVADTPLDFRTMRAVGERIENDHRQLRIAGGYDHNFVLDRKGDGLQPAASVREPATGRTLEVLTTEPGVQLYTANFGGGTFAGKAGRVYRRRSGLCLETQHFPDSPNRPGFPDTILRPGTEYLSTTVWRFGTFD